MTIGKVLRKEIERLAPGISESELDNYIFMFYNEHLRGPCEKCGNNINLILERNDHITGWVAHCLKCDSIYELDDDYYIEQLHKNIKLSKL